MVIATNIDGFGIGNPPKAFSYINFYLLSVIHAKLKLNNTKDSDLFLMKE